MTDPDLPRPGPWPRRLSIALILLALAGGALALFSHLARITRGPDRAPAVLLTIEVAARAEPATGESRVIAEAPPLPERLGAKSITVATLNLAHGRADGAHQVLTPAVITRANLDWAGGLLEQHSVHLVGLQEADGPSTWSGGFDHVARFATAARLPHAARAENVSGLGLRYGVALASAWPLRDAVSLTFPPTPPTPAKGALLASVTLDQSPTGALDVVVAHLDFSSADARLVQVEVILEAVRDRTHPLIVMGDLNDEWKSETLQRLVSGLGLSTWAPEAEIATFPLTGARIDWILVGRGLEIEAHQVLEAPISDHRAVVARVRFLAGHPAPPPHP